MRYTVMVVYMDALGNAEINIITKLLPQIYAFS